jgi:monoamine oxidase
VALHRGAPARTIRWKKGSVEIDALSTYRARAAVIALPLAVVKARADDGGIAFAPDLESKRPLLEYLDSGQVVRVVFRLREPVWQRIGAEDVSFLHAPELDFPTWWTAFPDRTPQLTAWCGAERAVRLAKLGPAKIADRAAEALADLVRIPRSELDALIVSIHHHPFGTDPRARGAYSFVRVGGTEARRGLQEPEAGTIVLAGEYTERADPGPVAAAGSSGQRAARALVSAMG